jgi:NADPH-dependent 2,4-dienoyl-CoA reductase/sulfur reductase-like enzyme/ferredoxin
MVADAQTTSVRIASRSERTMFPNYTQLPVRVPIGLWKLARVATLAGALALAVTLIVAPSTGLPLFWKLLVPLLPLLWLCLPGLWRNLCPLAASNQVPRVLGFTRGWTTPSFTPRWGYVIGIAAFVVLVPARKVLFNRSGIATGLLLLVVLTLAFTGGVLFKGKSGWCSTVCPLLPVQQLYGETPYVLVRNSHCEPCLGCAKNCYDFNPRAERLADLYDDPQYAAPRRFFAAVFPGLVLGFFSMPYLPAQSTVWVYGRIALFVAASVAAFMFAETFLPISVHKLAAVFTATAFCAFYWYSVPTLVDTIGRSPGGTARSVPIWLGRLLAFAIVAPWLVRTFAKERPFLAAYHAAPTVSPVGLGALRSRAESESAVTFHPDGPEVAVATGTPLLDVIERAGLPIEAGCRMGACGADPVAIVSGMESLSSVGSDEKSTLARLGLAETTRLACQARVNGACVVSLHPERASENGIAPTSPHSSVSVDRSVRRLVILGNGIAGATAADHARRLHPECAIDLVGLEPHRLYNRMAIERLIYGRSAMKGLYLLADSWHEDNEVTCWLNTRARVIDREARTVTLATGESVGYDRLVIATGSRSVELQVPDVGLPGSFTLRRAEDAIAIRSYVQEHDVRRAVIAGAGPLGIEAAYALHKLGVGTTILARGPWLMERQLDEPAARVLERYLEALGIAIMTAASTQALTGEQRVRGLVLDDGRGIDCQIFLACPGMVPNAELARDAGLEVRRGIVVDEWMRTSDPLVFAAGDVAELRGEIVGLWPQSARQGEIAGVNAVGGHASYTPTPPTALLKVVGVDVASIGRISPATPEDVTVALQDDDGTRYRKLVIADGRIVGAILVGHSRDLPTVQRAIEERRDVSSVLDSLRGGEWQVLEPA